MSARITPPATFGRIGVFGSLCNPPHIGHLILCGEAADQCGLDRVVLVPTGTPPHRPAPPEPTALRLRMAQAAAATDPRFTTSSLEVQREGPSYMVDTLRELTLRYPGEELVLLLGADQLVALGRWHQAEQIPRLARIAVAPRSGVAVQGLERAAVLRIEMPMIEISSSAIRARVAAGRTIRHLVPETVRRLIEAEGLYRPEPVPRAPAAPPNGVLAWDED